MPSTVAYSYVRFSSAAQAAGDSLRRQTERAEEYCRRQGWALDTTLTLRDLGVSAFRGKNAAVGNFRTFLDAIQCGKVLPGSVLLVESFDRISRQGIDEGYDLIKGILKAGVRIVTLSPEREFDASATKSLSKGALEIQLILERAAEESERKSDRVGAAWVGKRKTAADRPLTRRTPVWIAYDEADRKLKPIPDKVKVVRRLMRMAVEGVGLTGIAQAMIAERVPVLGCQKYEGGEVVWSAAMVWKIVTSRALVGEYQPHSKRDGERKPAGPPVKSYYPAVATEDEFAAVQAALRARQRVGRGRPGKRVGLFAGLLKDARTGGSIIARHTTGREPVLVSLKGTHGRGGRWSCFPLNAFESAIRSQLEEVKVEELGPEGPAVGRLNALRARRTELEELIAKWRAKMNRPELVDIVAENLAELETARKDTEMELADAEREDGTGLAAALGQLKTVGKAVAEDDSPANRLRCRAAIRAAVSEVRCLFMPGRGARLAVVQVVFKGGAHRDYIIIHRAAGKSRWGAWAAKTDAKSFKSDTIGGELDLGNEAHVTRLEKDLLRAMSKTG
jgi:DNA invertase Pin-like site-specific DNA recombinase